MTQTTQSNGACMMAILFAIALLSLAWSSLSISQDDIDKCVETTGYTEKRCLQEISR